VHFAGSPLILQHQERLVEATKCKEQGNMHFKAQF